MVTTVVGFTTVVKVDEDLTDTVVGAVVGVTDATDVGAGEPVPPDDHFG